MQEKPEKNIIEFQRKTYPLKLKLNEEQTLKIDSFLEEYKKITNFIIDKAINHLFPFFIRLEEKNWEKSTCYLCNKKKDLKFKFKAPNGTTHKNCGCLNGHFSMRKLFLPSHNYNLKQFNSTPEFDIRFAGKLYEGYPKLTLGGDTINGGVYNRAIYDSCLQKAVETIKSQNALNKKIDWETQLNIKRNQDLQAFLFGQGKGLSKESIEYFSKIAKQTLKKFLKRNTAQISKLEKKKAQKVIFLGNMARLYNSYYSLDKTEKEFFITIKIFSKPMQINFFGKDYQQKKAQLFIRQPIQPEIELLKRKNNYFLQYIFRKTKPQKITSDNKEKFTAIGIDVSIKNHYVMACLSPESIKPFNTRFFNGRALKRKKRQFYKIRRIWAKKTKLKEKGGKGKAKSWLNKKFERQNERNYVKTELHKISAQVLHYILGSVENPVLILRELKGIRNQTKTFLKIQKKPNISLRKLRYLNKEFNSWNFKQLQEFLKYKAEWLGIPVQTVSDKKIANTCNKCGDVNVGFKVFNDFFECLSCGYRVNKHFNVAVNLAKSFFA